MKRILLFLLIAVIVFISVGTILLYTERFISPIRYQNEPIIRNDGRGNGYFGTHRSGGRSHQGLDLLAPMGTPILASRSGIVTSAKQVKGMGKYVVIRHFGGYTTLYGHLSQIYVHKGQIVFRGKAIGLVGKTGNANYRNILPHVHFELRKSGIPQDPLLYLD
jgi:murein DD-endopeptidase MepM/ murein hydrolase activator NlpD